MAKHSALAGSVADRPGNGHVHGLAPRHRIRAVPRYLRSSLVVRSLTLVLVGLLVLAPFLHGHVGASHITGFHLDGLDLHHATQDSTGAGHVMEEPDDESLAVSVATSLPRVDADNWTPMDLVWLCILILTLPVLTRRVWRPRAAARVRAHRPYLAGWPPPALAPPFFSSF